MDGQVPGTWPRMGQEPKLGKVILLRARDRKRGEGRVRVSGPAYFCDISKISRAQSSERSKRVVSK